MNWDSAIKEILNFRLSDIASFIEVVCSDEVIQKLIHFKLTENGFTWREEPVGKKTFVAKGANALSDKVYNFLRDIYLIYSQPTKFHAIYCAGLNNFVEINVEHHFNRNVGRIPGVRRGEKLIVTYKGHFDIGLNDLNITTTYTITRAGCKVFEGELDELLVRILI